ncbi:GPI-anchored cupredoxin-like protein 3 [Seiridium cupressi]
MQNLMRFAFLLAAVANALPQPIPQNLAATSPAVLSPEEAAAQARAAFMPDGFTAQANQIIPVVVGGTQDTFVPNVVTAAVGDVFQFSNGNHTVTQSAQDVACQPLQATVATAIHSGHIPFVDGQTTVGTFNMPVLSTDPMFFATTQQIVDYAKLSAASGQSGDGTTVVGGTVAQIPLDLAAFTPAVPQAAAPPAAAAPADPAGAPSSAAAAVPVSAITLTLPPVAPVATDAAAAGSSTTTITVTVPPAAP